ncbi:VOC family protein, partial [Klebsiella quasipneumoniae]
MSFCHMRIARPVSELDTTASMYCAGLGLEPLGSFTDHEGFSGIMLGAPEAGWHLEFTHCRHHPVTPSAGDEDLLVLYYPQQAAWEAQCAAMDAAGFLRVTAFNPYWEVNGVT